MTGYDSPLMRTRLRSSSPPPEVDIWALRAGYAYLWARLLLEIPRQVDARMTAGRDALERRIEELEDHFATDAEIPLLRRRASANIRYGHATPSDRRSWALVVLSVTRRLPKFLEASVNFGLTSEGEISVGAHNVQRLKDRDEALPDVVDAPKTLREAKDVARDLVRRAIRHVEDAVED